MRKKRNVTEFFFPGVTDLASVKEKDIRAVLPAPKECGSISRQRSSLKFDCSAPFMLVIQCMLLMYKLFLKTS